MNKVHKWIQISFFNLLIVALLGVTLRYKIAYSLPIVDQKHLLHGHSHFAFSGWITQIIMVLMVQALSLKSETDYFKKYNAILWGNLITAYGMLISFPIQGYGLYSIGFSTLSIINSYWFGIVFWKDMNSINQKLNSFLWYKAGIVFNVLSSAGAFFLAFLMASKSLSQTAYLLSVYGFLHFQYNGWFFFAIIGLVVGKVETLIPYQNQLNKIFWIFFIACVPAYFLSALWLNLPKWLYALILLAALGQCLAWVYLWRILQKYWSWFSKDKWDIGNTLLVLSSISLSIKLFLQLLSTVPLLSNIAFGFRPIVIGYLHLMLLGVISIALIGYLIKFKFITLSKISKLGLYIFILGIILNQILLMLQGLRAMQYTGMIYISEMLLSAAIVMLTGLVFLNYGIFKSQKIN